MIHKQLISRKMQFKTDNEQLIKIWPLTFTYSRMYRGLFESVSLVDIAFSINKKCCNISMVTWDALWKTTSEKHIKWRQENNYIISQVIICCVIFKYIIVKKSTVRLSHNLFYSEPFKKSDKLQFLKQHLWGEIM